MRRTRKNEWRIVTAIARVGPRNLSEISRITGIHQETVRYQINERFGRRGFGVHAQVDYERIGLKPYWGFLRLAPSHHDRGPQLFELLRKEGYLTLYAEAFPTSRYFVLFTLPEGGRDGYEELLSWLQSKGIFSEFNLKEATVHVHSNMNMKYFGFGTGRWSVNWKEVEDAPTKSARRVKRTQGDTPDHYDLLILGELQDNALLHVTDIASKLKINPKTLEYHYHYHVVGRGLISVYWMRWNEIALRTKGYAIAMTCLTVRTTGRRESERVKNVIGRIPFVFMEDLMDDYTYMATMYLPLVEIVPMLRYVSAEFGEPLPGAAVEFINLAHFSFFPIPLHMWKDGKWTLDVKKMKAAVEKEYLA